MQSPFHEAVLVAVMVMPAVVAVKAEPALPEGVTATPLAERIEHHPDATRIA